MLTSASQFCCDAFDSCPERITKQNSRSLSKMGNGSVKPKHSKNPDGQSGNLTASALRSKVTELERELRRKDAEIQEREYHLKELREQLSKQTVAIAELTEELQSKCIQLNKLQDVVHMQGGSPCQASPDKVPLEVHRKTSGLVSLHSRRGAKAGVSAEPTTRTYDLNKPPEFSFEKARVRKDSSEKKLITDALNKNQFLKRLDPQQIKDMVECMYGRNYQQGSYIIKQGEPGNHIFVLAAITNVKTWALDREVFQNIMRRTAQARDEQYRNFLRSEDVRSANIIAEENDVACLVIDRETFNQTVGTFEELQKYLEGYVANLNRDDEKRHAKRSMSSWKLSKALSLEMIQLKEKVARFSSSSPFQNLEIIATLGVGGFGRVELVKVKNENVAFAMKCIRKKHIVDTKQQEHVYSEKRILEELCSPFIVKGSFDEPTSKFCVACVTEAFDYLHRLGIIYRDLKPENLILDAEGYLKLVDFGFAKKIGSGQKTWTFCGTPEYVAPEVILNKGHDFSVDFWSLGILVYELLTGNPPFSGIDQMMTYNLILKGIEKMDFPRKITRRPEDLIRRLCRQNPTERLGNLKNGINDIKKHRCKLNLLLDSSSSLSGVGCFQKMFSSASARFPVPCSPTSFIRRERVNKLSDLASVVIQAN
ncbi:cGMP-dependent protein kinase 2 [Camelus ferus]|nr:cGMP-dependent protein kinase 2 [Camelus ferus]